MREAAYDIRDMDTNGIVQWERITVEDLHLALVMALDRDDFRKEIDKSYRQVAIVLAFTGPVAILLTVLSASLPRASPSQCTCTNPPAS